MQLLITMLTVIIAREVLIYMPDVMLLTQRSAKTKSLESEN